MPPREAPRCLYPSASGHPCGKPARGRPPLCVRHERYRGELEDDADYEVDELVGSLVDNPAVKEILGKFNHLLDNASSFLSGASRRQMRRPPTSPTAPLRGDMAARAILGFGPEDKLTKTLIKDRQRSMAKMAHPDHGGSNDWMSRINSAADFLLKITGE